MNEQASFVFQLILRSYTHPRAVAQYLTSIRLDQNTLWMVLGLVVVLTALVFTLASQMAPPPPELAVLAFSPFTACLVLGFMLVALVFALYFTGHMLGGTGHFPETILIVAWHQVITIAFQILQLVIVLVSPVLGGLASLAGLALLFYIMLHFIDVLHGFNSLARAFGTFAFALVGMVIGFAIMLSIIGVSSTNLG